MGIAVELISGYSLALKGLGGADGIATEILRFGGTATQKRGRYRCGGQSHMGPSTEKHHHSWPNFKMWGYTHSWNLFLQPGGERGSAVGALEQRR